MADYWTTPKINWVDSDGISYADLNRIEANISANRDGNFRKVQGLGYKTDNTVVGEDGVLTVLGGSCYSQNAVPMRSDAAFAKNLTTWAAGNGAAFGGMASAVTVAAQTWYYIFLIMNPINGDVEIMFDDNFVGTNVSSGVYTEIRRIGSFRTANAGGDGSFDLIEMYSLGDHTYINPNQLSDEGTVFLDSGGNLNGVYQTITLTLGSGHALPALSVRADLNVVSKFTDYGLMSLIFGVMTSPVPFMTGDIPEGEFVFKRHANNNGFGTADLAIMVDSARQIKMAGVVDTGGGYVDIRVRGFHDERIA